MKKILIISVVSIFVVLISALGFYFNQAKKYKQLSNDKQTILTHKERVYKNDSLQNVSNVIQWQLDKKELKRAYQKNEIDRSEYENKLSSIYNKLLLSESKVKNIKSYYESLLSSRDTFYQPMPADCYLKPIHEKHINIDFIYQDSLVGVAYKYQTGQNIVVTLFPKPKKNGDNHWFLPRAGWLWGWDSTSVWTVEDKNANITNQVSIIFKK